MKNIFLPLFCLVAIQLQAQPDLSVFKDFEVNRCFASYPLDSNNLDTFYIEIVPPVFEGYLRPVLETDLNGRAFNNYPSTPAYTKYIKRNLRADCINNSDVPIKEYSGFCLLEVPPVYSPVTNKDSLIFFNQMTQEAQIRVISKKEALISKNEVYPIKGGQWTPWKEVLCSTRARFGMKDIQRALIKAGYDLEINGIIGDKDKEALIDFQKKNNLPVGRLDIETLKKLGVEF